MLKILFWSFVFCLQTALVSAASDVNKIDIVLSAGGVYCARMDDFNRTKNLTDFSACDLDYENEIIDCDRPNIVIDLKKFEYVPDHKGGEPILWANIQFGVLARVGRGTLYHCEVHEL